MENKQNGFIAAHCQAYRRTVITDENGKRKSKQATRNLCRKKEALSTDKRPRG